MPQLAVPKIYHIVHVDRLPSIIADGSLWSDVGVLERRKRGHNLGTTIGMNTIKQRRRELELSSHPGLRVGECVPFYFCPRSVMLYLIYCANHPELSYRGGQDPIVHLEADLHESIAWAERNRRRWAFTLSNAGSYYFEDHSDLARLREINWDAVQADQWSGSGIPASTKEGKQAEFLVERSFPWELIGRIGVASRKCYERAGAALQNNPNRRPDLEIIREWYY